MARLLAGEEQAFRDCYELHAPRTLALLVRMLRDGAQAEEILQETFVAVFKKVRQYRGEARFGTWIGGIAVRRALNALRDQGRRIPTEPAGRRPDTAAIGGGGGRAAAPDAGEESDISRRDLARRVLGLLDKLPEEKRIAILLYAEGYTAAEIATLTHAPRATVLARIARGRADLLNLAAQAGMAQDEDEIRGGNADQELNRG